MINQIKNIYSNAAAFLQQGVAPPNTPPEQQKALESINHLASKKFFITMSAFLILGIAFCVNMVLLYNMDSHPNLLPSYVVIFSKTIEVFAAIMAVYLGGQAVVDLKYNSSSNASISENIQKTEIQQTTSIAIEKEEDYSLD
jgi:hypothetical protein